MLVVRVVAYFLDLYMSKSDQVPRAALEADIKAALKDVNHPARQYVVDDSFVERTVHCTLLDTVLVVC